MPSLQFGFEARHHIVHRRLGGAARIVLSVSLGRKGIPGGVAGGIHIQAGDHAIQQADTVSHRQPKYFVFEGFEVWRQGRYP